MKLSSLIENENESVWEDSSNNNELKSFVTKQLIRLQKREPGFQFKIYDMMNNLETIEYDSSIDKFTHNDESFNIDDLVELFHYNKNNRRLYLNY